MRPSPVKMMVPALERGGVTVVVFSFPESEREFEPKVIFESEPSRVSVPPV